jgi:DNA-binding PadR family transcriptional regulator
LSVPFAVLGLLESRPSHGYELKQAYDAVFAHARPLRFGQLYATLGRLERDGLVAPDGLEPGHGPERKRFVITDDGVTDLDRWIREPETPEPYLQPTLFVKVVLALQSDRDAAAILDRQRSAHLRRMRELTALKASGRLADRLLADHGLFHLEADVRFIDLSQARLEALRAEVTR